jgi:hypothetical protein
VTDTVPVGHPEWWREEDDDPRSDAKDTLLEYTLKWPEGTPVVRAVRDEVGLSSEVGSAEHRLALRFYDEDYPHLFNDTNQEPDADDLSEEETEADGAEDTS